MDNAVTSPLPTFGSNTKVFKRVLKENLDFEVSQVVTPPEFQVPIHKFPTELEENPYLYYANKAKQKKIKNKTSIKANEKNQKFKVDS